MDNIEISPLQTSNEPPKSKLNKVIVGVLIALILAGLGGIYWYYPKDTNTTGGNPVSNTEKSYFVDDFYVVVGGELSRNASGYNLVEDFLPVLFDYSKRELPLGAIDQIPNTSLYKIEVFHKDGKTDVYNTSLMYTLPGDDVTRKLTDTELSVNEQGLFNSVVIKVSSDVEKLNYYIGNKVVKTLVRKEPGPRITNFTKEPADQRVNNTIEQGFKIVWAIENKNDSNAALSLEYKTSPDEWRSPTAGPIKGAHNDFFVNPADDTRTTLDKIDYRLIVTDGFHANVWYEKDFITVSQQRTLDLGLDYGTIKDGSSWVVGQNGSIDLSFIDPETGQGCGPTGCANGNYKVTWSSDKQTICSGDLSEYGVTYFFKKEGAHTITVKVEHKDKPNIKAEKSIKVLVGPTSYPPSEDRNPGCSS